MSKIRPGHKANSALNGEWGKHVRKWQKKITSGQRRNQDKIIIMTEKQLADELELLSPPGDTILELLISIAMTKLEFMQQMHFKEPNDIAKLVQGEMPITQEIANDLERVLKIDAQFWLIREALYREKLAKITA